MLAGILVLGGLLATVVPADAQENALPEYQVKALFLYNFAKYIEWPPAAFFGTNSPITIGIIGEDNFGAALPSAVNAKTVGGRSFAIKHLSANDNLQGCQILFISGSESANTATILGKVGAQPILTVGEDGTFLEEGGIINFVLKNGNVRLEINLASSDKAGLKISSRLLAVADIVKRKAGAP